MHPGDAFDLVVQRYGGFVLLFVGVLALVTAAAGYHRYLPPPFSAPIFRPSCIGCRQLTELSRLLVDLGIFCLVAGPVAMPHNRRNRDAARRSA
jgi:hypothetical protein